MINPLLDSPLPVGEWLSTLPRVSAKLYETDITVWERFEPRRKRLQDTLSFLDYEGEIDLAVTRANEVLQRFSSILHGVEWLEVAQDAYLILADELHVLVATSHHSGGSDAGARMPSHRRK